MAARQQIAGLWKEAFHDSDEFISLFFDRVYKPENTLCIERGGEAVSALQMLPYEIKIGERCVSSAYVCGVCTRESERGKGLMNSLMQQAMGIMKQRGYALAFLIPAEPWLFDYYKKLGYGHIIKSRIETHCANEKKAGCSCKIIPCNGDKYFSYFDKMQHGRENAVLHNRFDFETICRDCVNDGGGAWIALDGGEPVGIAFEAPDTGNSVFVKDVLCNQTAVKDELIQHILKRHGAKTAHVRAPAKNGKDAYAYASACILDEKTAKLPGSLFVSLMLD